MSGPWSETNRASPYDELMELTLPYLQEWQDRITARVADFDQQLSADTNNRCPCHVARWFIAKIIYIGLRMEQLEIDRGDLELALTQLSPHCIGMLDQYFIVLAAQITYILRQWQTYFKRQIATMLGARALTLNREIARLHAEYHHAENPLQGSCIGEHLTELNEFNGVPTFSSVNIRGQGNVEAHIKLRRHVREAWLWCHVEQELGHWRGACGVSEM